MNDLAVFLLLGMLPCFGALVVPRYGQSILFLVGAAVLMCHPCTALPPLRCFGSFFLYAAYFNIVLL